MGLMFIVEERSFSNASSVHELTPKRGRSFNIHFARLLSEQEINKVKDKFYEDIEFLLEEALRKHVINKD